MDIKWSKNKPEKSGYYWLRCSDEGPQVVKVNDSLRVVLPFDNNIGIGVDAFSSQSEWAGPIDLPID